MASNHMPSEVWDEITCPFSNFNGCTDGFWEWITDFILQITVDATTYPCWYFRLYMLVKGSRKVRGQSQYQALNCRNISPTTLVTFIWPYLITGIPWIKSRTTTQRWQSIKLSVMQLIIIHPHIDGLAQDYSNSSALAMELLQSCTKPSILFMVFFNLYSNDREKTETSKFISTGKYFQSIES